MLIFNPHCRRKSKRNPSDGRGRKQSSWTTWPARSRLQKRWSGTGRFANPVLGAMGGIGSSATAGWQPKALLGVIPIAAGALLNKWLVDQVAARWLPPDWATGWRRALVSAASAGLLGGVATFANKKVAAQVLAGGLLQTVVQLALPMIMPMAAAPAALPAPAIAALKGFDDMGRGQLQRGAHAWAPEFEEQELVGA